jgi:hypothetical protein
MPNYQQGKIYKLVSPHTDYIYIGSTTKKYLCQRLGGHTTSFNYKIKTGLGSNSSHDLIQFGDVEIILLESYPCNSKDELHSRERYWIENTDNVINARKKPHITEEERHEYSLNRKLKRYNCICGSINISHGNKKEHEKTDKHQTYMMIQTL